VTMDLVHVLLLTPLAFGALLHSLQKGTNRKSKKPPPFAKKGMSVIARLEVIGTNLLCIERLV
jgi:peptide chain release factor subunit 3